MHFTIVFEICLFKGLSMKNNWYKRKHIVKMKVLRFGTFIFSVIFSCACNWIVPDQKDLDHLNFNYYDPEKLKIALKEVYGPPPRRKSEIVNLLNDLRYSALAHNDKQKFKELSLDYFSALFEAGQIRKGEYETFDFLIRYDDLLKPKDIAAIYFKMLYNSDYYERKETNLLDSLLLNELSVMEQDNVIERKFFLGVCVNKYKQFTEKEHLDMLDELLQLGIDSSVYYYKRSLFLREKKRYAEALQVAKLLNKFSLKSFGQEFSNNGELGVFYRDVDSLEKAEIYLLRSHQPAKSNMIECQIIPGINLAKLYTKYGDFQKAEDYIRMADSLSFLMKNEKLIQEVFATYKLIYKAFNKDQKLIEALQRENEYFIDQHTNFFKSYNTSTGIINIINKNRVKNRNRNYLVAAIILFSSLLLIYLIRMLFRVLNKSKRERKAAKLAENKMKELNTKLVDLTIKSETKEKVLQDIRVHLKNQNNDSDGRKDLLKDLKNLDNLETDWENFKSSFSLIYPNFFGALLDRDPSLSVLYLKHASYIKLNLTISEVSKILGINGKSVSIARYRLRLKLGFKSSQDLNKFIHNL